MRLCVAVLPSSLSSTLSVSLVDRRSMECYPTVLVVLIVYRLQMRHYPN